jgi:hypothetical protein
MAVHTSWRLRLLITYHYEYLPRFDNIVSDYSPLRSVLQYRQQYGKGKVVKAFWGQIHVFLTSALVGGEWSASRTVHFIPGEIAPILIGPRAGLHDIEKRKILPIPGLQLRPLGRPGP